MSTDIVEAAQRWLGTSYRHQASTLGAGCDCLGLLRGVWRELYGSEPMPIPPYRADWRDRLNAGALQIAAETCLAAKLGPLAAGDVVLFRLHQSMPPKHCGIMISDIAFMHAQEQLGVVSANMTAPWQRRLAGIYQFPERTH